MLRWTSTLMMIAARMMPPFSACCQKGSMPTMLRDLLMTAMVTAPQNTPTTLPWPPLRLTPPMTQAAMMSISEPVAISFWAEA